MKLRTTLTLLLIAGCASPAADETGGIGAPCALAEDCPESLFCVESRCDDIPMMQKCVSDDTCGAGTCIGAMGGPAGDITNVDLFDLVDTFALGCSDWYPQAREFADSYCDHSSCGCEPPPIPSGCEEPTDTHLVSYAACAAQPGTRGPGRSCSSSAGCEAGLWCYKVKREPLQVGVCATLRSPETSCFTKAECKPSLGCVGNLCSVGVPAGAPCDTSEACATGLVCPTATRVCTPSAGEKGDPCQTNADCAPHRLECRGGVCSNPFGSRCSTDYQCGDGGECAMILGGQNEDCYHYELREALAWANPCSEPDTVCELTKAWYTCGTCLPARGSVVAGGSCWRHVECGPSLICRSHKCQPPGLDGDSCEEEHECAPLHRCDVSNRYGCRVLGGLGDPCGEPVDCEEGLACSVTAVPSTCQPRAGVGVQCAAVSDCEAGLTCTELTEPATCQERQGFGEPCLTDGDCSSQTPCWQGLCGCPFW